MELVGAPLLVVQQPVVPEVDRIHAGRGRARSRRSGARAATTTPCSSTAASTGRSRSRSTRPRRRPASRCTSCHSISHVGSTMGQGDFTIEYPPLHDLAASEQPGRCALVARLADVHRPASRTGSTFLKPFHREQTPEFCSSCHKVHLDVPVNAYRWFRGFNDYDNWQASGVSGEGARSFYYPPKPQKCADCHMPLVAVERSRPPRTARSSSHRFPARQHRAAVRERRRGAARRSSQDFLQDGQVTVDVFGLVRGADGARAPRRRPPARRRAAARQHVRRRRGVDELRRARRRSSRRPSRSSRRSTRSTPSCAAASRCGSRSWCARGRSATSSPAAPSTRSTSGSSSRPWTTRAARSSTAARVEDGGKGPVEPGAHFYRSLLLDEHGNPINKRNAWMARSVAYVRLIPPGAADTIHYRLQHPRRTRATASRCGRR